MKKIAAAALAAVLIFPVLLMAVGKGHDKDAKPDEVSYPMTYGVVDLPVWRKTGTATDEFAPDVLIKFLQSTVDPESWKAGAEIRPFAARSSLVITQTQANHEKISGALEAFRKVDPREVRERVQSSHAEAPRK